MIDNWIKKGLVIAVIFLFVVVSFQPVDAKLEYSSAKVKSIVNKNTEVTRFNNNKSFSGLF
jgi:hypothetical protein